LDHGRKKQAKVIIGHVAAKSKHFLRRMLRRPWR